MKKLLIAAILPLMTASAFAAAWEDVARVDSVTPQMERVRVPGTCHWVSTEVVSAQGNSGTGGSIVGGVVGGLLGSQVGGGSGRHVATAVGAIAGAIAGGNIDRNTPSEPSVTQRQVCEGGGWASRTSGYLVHYNYRGQPGSVMLPYDPGNELPMRVTAEPIMR